MPRPNLARVTGEKAPRLTIHRPPPAGGLSHAVHDLQQMLDSEQTDSRTSSNPPIVPVTQSQKMEQVLVRAKRFAKSSATLLLTGESGTGKELIASLIHHHSPRGQQPYVRMNCAALAETLVEAELFGHERGAFTGAV